MIFFDAKNYFVLLFVLLDVASRFQNTQINFYNSKEVQKQQKHFKKLTRRHFSNICLGDIFMPWAIFLAPREVVRIIRF